jgi:hypothetical protein
MTSYRSRSLLLLLLLLLFLASSVSLAQPSPQEQPPDDVRGDWTIYSESIDTGETVEKHVRSIKTAIGSRDISRVLTNREESKAR